MKGKHHIILTAGQNFIFGLWLNFSPQTENFIVCEANYFIFCSFQNPYKRCAGETFFKKFPPQIHFINLFYNSLLIVESTTSVLVNETPLMPLI